MVWSIPDFNHNLKFHPTSWLGLGLSAENRLAQSQSHATWCHYIEVRPVWFQFLSYSYSGVLLPHSIAYHVSFSHSSSRLYPLHPQISDHPHSYHHHHHNLHPPPFFAHLSTTSLSSLSSSSCLLLPLPSVICFVPACSRFAAKRAVSFAIRLWRQTGWQISRLTDRHQRNWWKDGGRWWRVWDEEGECGNMLMKIVMLSNWLG